MLILRCISRGFIASIAIVCFVLSVQASASEQNQSLAVNDTHRILVFGDSISWGWMPVKDGAPTQRFSRHNRWPAVMEDTLGNDYKVMVNAISGRTTNLDDPTYPYGDGAILNGSKALPKVIAAHLPLDLVVIFLGTNDLKKHFHRSPFKIALGAGQLVALVQSSGQMFGSGWYQYPAPKVLLIAPPPLGKQDVFGDTFAGGVAKSKHLAETYHLIAKAAGVAFLDAGSVIETDGVDGVHLTAATQREFGKAVAKKIRSIFGQ